MDLSRSPLRSMEEYRANLARDGGRRVMYGGNAYEDDLEPDGWPPSDSQATEGPSARTESR